MAPPARPTLRCLSEDLADDITDHEFRRAHAERKPPPIHIPLHEVGHPLLQSVSRKVQAAPYEHKDRISAVTDNVWYRHDHSQMRGAVWTNEQDGQSWLGYKGLRRKGDHDDAYEVFERVCADGSAKFLPNEHDEKRLKAELAWARRQSDKQQHCWDVVETLLQAIANEGQKIDTPILRGNATLSVRIVLSDPDELWLTVVVNDHAGVTHSLVADVIDVVPGVPRSDWAPEVVIEDGPADIVWSAAVDRAWIERLQTTAEDFGVGHIVEEPGAMADDPGGFAHTVRKDGLTEATTNGHFVRALCGLRFVPTKDPAMCPVCPACKTEHEKIVSSING